MAAWMALSPYVHTSDQIVLTLPLLHLIGQSGRGLQHTAVLLAAVTCVMAPMVVFRDYHTVGINALPPLSLLVVYLSEAPKQTGVRETRPVAAKGLASVSSSHE